MEGRDKFEGVSKFLVGFALLAAGFGRGRPRSILSIAAVTGYLVWIIGHVGIL